MPKLKDLLKTAERNGIVIPDDIKDNKELVRDIIAQELEDREAAKKDKVAEGRTPPKRKPGRPKKKVAAKKKPATKKKASAKPDTPPDPKKKVAAKKKSEEPSEAEAAKQAISHAEARKMGRSIVQWLDRFCDNSEAFAVGNLAKMLKDHEIIQAMGIEEVPNALKIVSKMRAAYHRGDMTEGSIPPVSPKISETGSVWMPKQFRWE